MTTADPDFVRELKTFVDEAADLNIDSIIETLEDNDPNSSANKDLASSNESTFNPQFPQGIQRKPANQKLDKPTLLWKKKDLELYAQQLLFMRNKSLDSDIERLETPIQFFFYLIPVGISNEHNLYQVKKYLMLFE